MTDRVNLSGLTLVLPTGWLDITNDLPRGSAPTIAKEDGVGVIQFSVARYRSGVEPHLDVAALREMLDEFGDHHRLGKPVSYEEGQGYGGNRFVAAEFSLPDQVIAVWYLTNGRNVALITSVADGAKIRRWPASLSTLLASFGRLISNSPPAQSSVFHGKCPATTAQFDT